MIKRFVRMGLLVGLLAMALSLNACGVVGANLRLENVKLGVINMEGKPVDGLPSDKVNLDLDVSAQTITVEAGIDETVITIIPGGGSIHIKGNSVTLKGLKPEQVNVEWVPKPAD